MAKKIIFKLQIEEPERSREVTLKQGITTLGREPGNDIQLNFPRVSRRHARIECLDSICIIFDEESANGTIVDGTRIAPNIPIPLNDNSVVEIDPVRIVCKHTVVETAEEETPEESSGQGATANLQMQQELDDAGTLEEKVKEEPAKRVPPAEEELNKAEESLPSVQEMEEEPPPPSPPKPTAWEEPEPEKEWGPPPGLSENSIRFLDYLPSIYHTQFMSHFLAMFESILIPVEWNVDNFDMFLDPGTSPAAFLSWLSSWYDISFDASWPEDKRRQLLKEAHDIYSRRGTCWSLTRLLEIYTGQTPQILEFEKGMEAHTFKVILDDSESIDKGLVTRMINANKPSHTSYQLEFRQG